MQPAGLCLFLQVRLVLGKSRRARSRPAPCGRTRRTPFSSAVQWLLTTLDCAAQVGSDRASAAPAVKVSNTTAGSTRFRSQARQSLWEACLICSSSPSPPATAQTKHLPLKSARAHGGSARGAPCGTRHAGTPWDTRLHKQWRRRADATSAHAHRPSKRVSRLEHERICTQKEDREHTHHARTNRTAPEHMGPYARSAAAHTSIRQRGRVQALAKAQPCGRPAPQQPVVTRPGTNKYTTVHTSPGHLLQASNALHLSH